VLSNNRWTSGENKKRVTLWLTVVKLRCIKLFAFFWTPCMYISVWRTVSHIITMKQLGYFRRRTIWKTAWDRDEWLLANVTPDVRTALPCWISFITSSTFVISASFMPMICTCCLPSSSTRSFCLLFNKSNTCHSEQQPASHPINDVIVNVPWRQWWSRHSHMLVIIVRAPTKLLKFWLPQKILCLFIFLCGQKYDSISYKSVVL